MYQGPSWFLTNAFVFDNYPRNGTKYFVGEYASKSHPVTVSESNIPTDIHIALESVTSTNDTNPLGTVGVDGRLAFPTLQSAAAEAAFMTGLERNSDVVFAAACQSILNFFLRMILIISRTSTDAPSLQHIASYEWTPDLITFDAGSVVKSVSYYAQQVPILLTTLIKSHLLMHTLR